MRTLIKIIKNNIRYKDQIVLLAKADQIKRYKGSDLGVLWAFVKPAMYVAVFYLAITLGFKSAKNIEGIICPYFLWLTVGIVTWFYISSMLSGGANVFRKYKLYVTKVNYPLDIIPTILATSNLMVHAVLIAAAMILAVFLGVRPSIYWLEIPFYTAFMFLFAVAWCTASGYIGAISKDFVNFMQSISQAFFWLSAILFDINSVDNEAVQKVFLFNPITFAVEGYRNAICKHIWFWEEPEKLGCIMISFIVMLILALLFYKRLRKAIPDYL